MASPTPVPVHIVGPVDFPAAPVWPTIAGLIVSVAAVVVAVAALRQSRAALAAQTQQSKDAMEQQAAAAAESLELQRRREEAARPRLEVILQVSAVINIGGDEPNRQTYAVAVVNEGGAAAAVYDVGLRSDGHSEVSASRIAMLGNQAVGPELPAMIPAYGLKVWPLPTLEVSRTFGDGGVRVRGFARRLVTSGQDLLLSEREIEVPRRQ